MKRIKFKFLDRTEMASQQAPTMIGIVQLLVNKPHLSRCEIARSLQLNESDSRVSSALTKLLKLGCIRHPHMSGGRWRYELVGKPDFKF